MATTSKIATGVRVEREHFQRLLPLVGVRLPAPDIGPIVGVTKKGREKVELNERGEASELSYFDQLPSECQGTLEAYIDHDDRVYETLDDLKEKRGCIGVLNKARDAWLAYGWPDTVGDMVRAWAYAKPQHKRRIPRDDDDSDGDDDSDDDGDDIDTILYNKRRAFEKKHGVKVVYIREIDDRAIMFLFDSNMLSSDMHLNEHLSSIACDITKNVDRMLADVDKARAFNATILGGLGTPGVYHVEELDE